MQMTGLSSWFSPEQYNPARDDGNGISYVYDCHDHVIQVIGPDGELLQENTYNLSGAVETAETGGKIFERYEYDLTGNPTAFYQGKENAQKVFLPSAWFTMPGGM